VHYLPGALPRMFDSLSVVALVAETSQ